MNMQLSRVYMRRSDSVNREYLYEIGFTDDIVVMVVFELGRLYEMLDVKVVYNKWCEKGLKDWCDSCIEFMKWN